MPKRIQRTRKRGWKCPDGATYVGRPSPWGNPFRVNRNGCVPSPDSRADAVENFRLYVTQRPELLDSIKSALAGRDLVCWCAESDACHADILLEIANG